jgi:cell division protein FtsL
MGRSHSSGRVLLIFLAASAVASAMGIVASTHHVREGYARLQVLELERWRLKEQYTRLLLETNTWAAPHRIIQIASDNLSMKAPDLSRSQALAE